MIKPYYWYTMVNELKVLVVGGGLRNKSTIVLLVNVSTIAATSERSYQFLHVNLSPDGFSGSALFHVSYNICMLSGSVVEGGRFPPPRELIEVLKWRSDSYCSFLLLKSLLASTLKNMLSTFKDAKTSNPSELDDVL